MTDGETDRRWNTSGSDLDLVVRNPTDLKQPADSGIIELHEALSTETQLKSALCMTQGMIGNTG